MKWFLLLVGLLVAGFAIANWLAGRETNRRLAALEEQSRLIETRHGQLEYQSWGEGPTILVLHGAGGGFDQGALLAGAIGPDGHRTISVSRFGYLRSMLPDDASPTAQAYALVDLMDALGVERAHILAMSGGVPSALRFAALFPDRTGRLALLSSAPITPFSREIEGRPVPTWVYSMLFGNDTVYWLLSRFARPQLQAAFDAQKELMAAVSPEEQRFVNALIDGFLPASQRLPGLNNEGAAVDPSLDYGLGTITAESFIVHTEDDAMNPASVGAYIADGLPNATYLVLPSGGHLLLGHHQALRARLTTFLNADGVPRAND
ncbi:MAG: alpha/beta hydrolase [Hyphomicrobiales bacterium]|jgi:2-hydroxy-6-oxonona-2,4-dienedioate hydrolase